MSIKYKILFCSIFYYNYKRLFCQILEYFFVEKIDWLFNKHCVKVYTLQLLIIHFLKYDLTFYLNNL